LDRTKDHPTEARNDMNAKQAHGMLNFHQRMARAARKEADEPGSRKHRAKLLRDAEVADRRAAECQGICQIARMYGED
jgi:hypothetical protein